MYRKLALLILSVRLKRIDASGMTYLFGHPQNKGKSHMRQKSIQCSIPNIPSVDGC
jgi:hypothetical protein